MSWAATLRRWPWDVIAILAVAAIFRLVLLDLKPPHFDEGINGWFADVLRETGSFQYNPDNFHGPWHFYTVFLSQELFGRNLWALRGPAVLASLLTVPVTRAPSPVSVMVGAYNWPPSCIGHTTGRPFR